MASRTRTWAYGFAAVAAGSITALLLAEGMLRLFAPAPTLNRVSKQLIRLSNDPELRYELVPFATDGDIAINAEGRRDFHYPRKKGRNTFRIAVLGDSVAFGSRVPLGQDFAKRLERLLNRFQKQPDTHFEAWNYAVPGYGIREIKRALTTKVADDDPDLVIYAYCLNDPDPFSIELASLYKEMDDGDKVLLKGIFEMRAGARRLLYEHSRLWQLWENRRLAAGRGSQGLPHAEEYLLGFFRENQEMKDRNRSKTYQEYLFQITEQNWQAVSAALKQMGDFSAGHRMPIAVAIFPMLFRLRDYSLKAIHDAVAAEAEGQGIHVLDLLPGFQEEAERRSWPAMPEDPIHPGVEGHGLAAWCVARWLVEQHLLPVGPERFEPDFFKSEAADAPDDVGWLEGQDMYWVEQGLRLAAAGDDGRAGTAFRYALQLNPRNEAAESWLKRYSAK
jgi:hypothetical protein